MSKKILAACVFSFTSLGVSAAPANTSASLVYSIETRDGGYHSVYLSSAFIPDQGCILLDRGVINEYALGGKALFSTAIAALASAKQVVLRVDGCSTVVPGSPATAPKIIKVQIFN